MKRRYMVLLLILAICFAFFTSGTYAAERDSISVNGHASTEVSPDMAMLFGGLEKRALTAEEARNSLAKEMKAFKHLLTVQMIPDQDIQTVRYSLQPEYVYDKNEQRLKGYLAHAEYKIKIKNLEELGPVMDKSINCGLIVNRVEFGLNRRSLIENSLLDEAVTNARTKAAVVARAGGRTLGRLIHANLGTVTGATRTMNRNMLMAKTADAAETAATELDPGVIRVSVDVNLEFELE